MSHRDSVMVPRLLAFVQSCAKQGLPCPSNLALAACLGFASPSKPAEILARAEALGLARVTRGNNARVVAAADGSWTTAGEVTNPHWRDRSADYVPPPDRRKSWGAKADARLREMWADGAPAREIAAELRVTRNGVLGRAHRLGLQARPSPIRIAEDGAALRPRLHRTEAAAMPVPAVRRAPAAPPRRPMAKVAPLFAAVKRCRFPLWSNTERPDHRYCDAPVVRRAYCAAHGARCYEAPRRLGLAPVPLVVGWVGAA